MKKENGVRHINGKKFILNTPETYRNKENARYEALESRRDNKYGTGDPFLFRVVKHKKGYVVYLHPLKRR